MQTLQNKRTLSLLAILFSLSAVAIVQGQERSKAEAALACQNARATLTQSIRLPLASLEAAGIFAYDFTDGSIIHSENADLALPLASLTKLMTVRVALESRDPETIYTIEPRDLSPEGSIGLAAGERYRLRDLARAALIASSNDAALALSHASGLSDGSFLTSANAEARSLGLSSLQFKSVTGLDTKDEGGETTAYGSPRDILMLLERDLADFPGTFKETTAENASISSLGGKTISLSNTNRALLGLPLLTASKTGYTQNAGGNLAILWKAEGGHELGAAVLGSSEDGRFSDMLSLYTAANRLESVDKYFDPVCTK